MKSNTDLTKEQEDSLSSMTEKGMSFLAKQEALSFFEKRLGKVNKHVIDYRKSIKPSEKEFYDSQEVCHKNGSIDVLMNSVSSDIDTDNIILNK